MLSQRQKRQLRWTMMFETRDGLDYRNQLISMGAILAVQGPGGKTLLIKNLNQRPVQMEPGDVSKLKRICWWDNRPDSVARLAQALGIPAPPMIGAFFPAELEAQLLRKELSFKGRKEHEIIETRFRVVGRNGRYEPIVVDQIP
jgi:hypothetical protein